MSTATPLFPGTVVTGDLLAHLRDIGPCELVRGTLIPVPFATLQQGQVEAELGAWLHAQLDPSRFRVGTSEVGIYTRRDPDTIRGADIVVTANTAPAQRKGFLTEAPLLVAEIASPDQWSQLGEKAREYLAAGVTAVWLVDPTRQFVERHSDDGQSVYRVGDRIPLPDGASAPLPNVFE